MRYFGAGSEDSDMMTRRCQFFEVVKLRLRMTKVQTKDDVIACSILGSMELIPSSLFPRPG